MTAPPPRRARWHRWRHALGHSIQRRLLALFLLLALGTVAVFLYGTQRVVQEGWSTFARPLVADYVDRLAAELGSPPDVARAQALVQRLPISVQIDGPQVRWRSEPPREHRHSEPWGLLERRSADGHHIVFGLARVPDAERPRWIGWATLAALLGLTLVAFLTVRRLLAPLGPIAAGVEAYGQGDFSRPIPVRRRDELGALAERINGMAANLSGMLDAKRALLLAISHELRSPLTRARINAELVEDGAPRDALLRDLGEMRELISSLLESERLAQGHAALQAEATDLAALVRELVGSQTQPVQLELATDLPPVSVDATRLRLLLRNLLANAQRHAADAEVPPLLFLRREADGRLALGLRDHGPGVPADQLPRLAEAFYRPDAARSRSSGGVGLGLYLCRLVAQAHGGELRVRDAQPGLEVAMVWQAAA